MIGHVCFLGGRFKIKKVKLFMPQFKSLTLPSNYANLSPHTLIHQQPCQCMHHEHQHNGKEVAAISLDPGLTGGEVKMEGRLRHNIRETTAV